MCKGMGIFVHLHLAAYLEPGCMGCDMLDSPDLMMHKHLVHLCFHFCHHTLDIVVVYILSSCAGKASGTLHNTLPMQPIPTKLTAIPDWSNDAHALSAHALPLLNRMVLTWSSWVI